MLCACGAVKQREEKETLRRGEGGGGLRWEKHRDGDRRQERKEDNEGGRERR